MRTCFLLTISLLQGVLARNKWPAPHELLTRDVDPTELYPAHNFSVPIDHWQNDSLYEPHSDGYFNLRYWFDTTYYKPGGPVIVLQGGETDGSTRLPYLQKGIVYQLSKATGGIGVILEHRYYGESFPTADLSNENLRFLTTDQALADQAYFSQNIVFPGLEGQNLTSYTTAHIAYGGSYAGGFVAFLRKLYPDVYWGAISSSGVTEAIWDYWEYFSPIAEYAPSECVSTQQRLINVADNILLANNSASVQQLKTVFGMQTLTYDDDFANVLGEAMGYFQSKNWDPAVNSPLFDQYCGNISSDSLLWPDEESSTSSVQSLISAGGWGNESSSLTTRMLNWIGWINETFVAPCAGETLDECWGTHNASSTEYSDKSTDNYNSLSWAYQYCTQWGYLQTGSGVPADQLPLVSKLLTLQYESLICNFAFNITSPPNTTAINKYGGFNISYPRLAFVGGEWDVWRPATPLATMSMPDQLNRTSSASQPVFLIADAVHHWDENGVFPNETTPSLPPQPVVETQQSEAQWVQEWMNGWKQNCINTGIC